MLEINYTFTLQVVDIKSELTTPLKEEEADIYIDKQQGWLSFDIQYNPQYDFKSKVYDIKHTKTNTKLKTNTTALAITDVIVNDKPYYHRIIFNSPYKYSLDELKYLLGVEDLILHNNSYYTNTPVYLYNSEDEYFYTTKVIPELYEVTYKTKHIEITTSPNVKFKLDEYVISPQTINPYTMYLPSFYLETDTNTIYRCVDSNVNIFKSAPDNTSPNNYYKYKLNEPRDFNIAFTNNQEPIEFQISSHCIPLKNIIEYFTILSNGSIVKSTKDNYMFKITKNVNLDKIVITPNNYKTITKNIKNIVGSFVNSIEEDNKSLNDFGVTYRQIENKIPKYNYIKTSNNKLISFNRGATSFKVAFRENILKMDAHKLSKISDKMSIDTTNYVKLDNINYEVVQ